MTVAPSVAAVGSPRLTLSVAGGLVRAVEIGAAGGRVAAALVGRPAADAPRLAALLHPVCAAAHRSACAAALAAAGAGPTPRPAAARALAAEAATGAAARAALVWGGLLEAPEPAAYAAARAAAAEWVAGGPGGALARALRAALFGADAPEAAPEAVRDWSRRSRRPVARLIRAAAEGPEGVRPPLRLPPAPEAPEAEPDGPAEPGAYARLSPAEAAAFDGGGPVAARLLAILLAGARLCDALAAGDGRAEAAFAPRAAAAAPGDARAVVATARGPLRWRLSVADGRVTGAEVRAPTDWTLAPGGPAAGLLTGLPVRPGAVARALAAADPCGGLDVDERPHRAE